MFERALLVAVGDPSYEHEVRVKTFKDKITLSSDDGYYDVIVGLTAQEARQLASILMNAADYIERESADEKRRRRNNGLYHNLSPK